MFVDFSREKSLKKIHPLMLIGQKLLILSFCPEIGGDHSGCSIFTSEYTLNLRALHYVFRIHTADDTCFSLNFIGDLFQVNMERRALRNWEDYKWGFGNLHPNNKHFWIGKYGSLNLKISLQT